MKQLSPQYLSTFCMELRLLLRAEIEIGEGLSMLRGEHGDKASKAFSDYFLKSADSKAPLSNALEKAGLFPQYMTETVRLGEASGRLDEALASLSAYYKRRSRLSSCLRSAFLYPLMLFVAMTAVVIVLVTQVMPIFQEIYVQMGAQMSPLASSFLNFGIWLSSTQAILLSALAAFLVVGFSMYFIPPLRRTAVRGFGNHFGDRGIFGRVSSTKFASAMSLAVSSGLDPATSLSLARDVCRGSYGICKKVSVCEKHLESGDSFEQCLSKARIFSERDSRLLAVGKAAGMAGEVIDEIARHSEERIVSELDAKIVRLGPSFVIAACVIVGLTLLSVMLPILGVLSSLS